MFVHSERRQNESENVFYINKTLMVGLTKLISLCTLCMQVLDLVDGTSGFSYSLCRTFTAYL